MKKNNTLFRLFPLLIGLGFSTAAFSQINILCTNPAAEQVLLGNYDPAEYAASTTITDLATISTGIRAGISPDSLKSYLMQLSVFGTRNTGSDTASATTGIGAARRWTHQKLETFSAQREDRLLVSYLQFDQDICGMGQHRNIFAVLPGANPAANGVVLLEAHLDSRCSERCDVVCPADGMEDNGSGTALVLELARVMAQYTFDNTIVFLLTIGEEQGLLGAEAFAQYATTRGIPVRAVLNNDIVGGVACGETSSPPSCPGLGHIDSVGVRLFSSGSLNSRHKQLARFVKLQYQENLMATDPVPMDVRIMSPEDRSGRGGDHIPFREKGYPAIRFTSANEHGDASNGPDYTDRQHTSGDILGVDTDGNNVIDSFFVQFNYLARNAVINGNAAAVAARNVPTPVDFSALRSSAGLLDVDIDDPAQTGVYRVALRSLDLDWDTVYTLTGSNFGTFAAPPTGVLIVSVAAVDEEGAESLFGAEKIVFVTGTDGQEAAPEANITLFQNRPNPFDEATWISFYVNTVPQYRQARLVISDQAGRVIQHLPVQLQTGMNEVLYTHGYGVRGTFAYALQIDGQTVAARQMVFAY